MKIHTEQNNLHRKRMSVAKVMTVPLSLIKSGVTIVYIMEESKSIREKFKSTNWI